MKVPEVFLCIIVASAVGVSAQEQPNWMQRTEMQAHSSLIARIGRLDDRTINPFVTDGCSGGLSWTWDRFDALFGELSAQTRERPPWEGCCVEHDRAYHNISGAQNAADSFAARLQADEILRSCVTKQGQDLPDTGDSWGMTAPLYARLAESMFWAVRFGGGPCTGLSWRWGYGLENCWLR